MHRRKRVHVNGGQDRVLATDMVVGTTLIIISGSNTSNIVITGIKIDMVEVEEVVLKTFSIFSTLFVMSCDDSYL